LLAEVEDEGHVDHFSYKHGVIHNELVSERKRVKNEFYVQVQKRLLKQISRVRPPLCEKGMWFLLHKNAPADSVMKVKHFQEDHSIVEISHPLYSCDLMPDYFFLFPNVKIAPK
jgi:hypothetical protein